MLAVEAGAATRPARDRGRTPAMPRRRGRGTSPDAGAGWHRPRPLRRAGHGRSRGPSRAAGSAPRPGRVGEHERLLDEPAEQVEDVQRIDRVACAHRLRRLEGGAPGEDGQASQDGPLGLGQQVVAPVDRGPQRLVAGDGRPTATGQEAEPVVQAGRDLLDRQRPDTGRRKLDRQRDAVEPAAELGDRSGVLARSASKVGWTALARSTNSRQASTASRSARGRSPSRPQASSGTRSAGSPRRERRAPRGW